jgi:transposase
MNGRVHAREFKLQVVRALANGEKRPAQVCREFGLADSVLQRWRQEYAARGEAAFTPQEPSDRDALVARIAELERFAGQLALENAALKKALSRPPSPPATP